MLLENFNSFSLSMYTCTGIYNTWTVTTKCTQYHTYILDIYRCFRTPKKGEKMQMQPWLFSKISKRSNLDNNFRE